MNAKTFLNKCLKDLPLLELLLPNIVHWLSLSQ